MSIAELEALENEVLHVDAAAVAAELPPPAAETEEPTEGGKQEAQADAPMLNAQEEAEKWVGMAAWAVSQLYPMIGYTPETKAEGAKRLAPLLEKYNVHNVMFGKWAEEIEAGMFFGGIAYGTYMAIKTAKAVEAGEEDKHKEAWWRRIFKAGK